MLALIFCFIVTTSDYVITRQQLLSAARYGTDMIIHCNFNEDQVRQELTNYLTSDMLEGRRLSTTGLSFNIEINTFPTINQFNTKGNPLNLAKDLIASPLKYNATVTIQYKLQIFKWIAKLTGEKFFSVVARSEVFDGTGPENNHS